MTLGRRQGHPIDGGGHGAGHRGGARLRRGAQLLEALSPLVPELRRGNDRWEGVVSFFTKGSGWNIPRCGRPYVDDVTPELLPPYGRNDPCWCGSGRKYKQCHGSGPASLPGAPVPPDDDEGYWVSPTVRINRGAMRASDAFGEGGVPITVQREDRPVAGPLIVPKYGALLASASGVANSTFSECGMHRFTVLADYGLDDDSALSAQLDVLSDDTIADVAVELLRNARVTLDLLQQSAVSDTPRTALWTESSAVTSMIGQTLLWADLYLVEDSLLDAFLAHEEPERSRLRTAIAEALRLRPLVEAGLVVPVPTGAGVTLAAHTIHQSTERDLADRKLMDWVDRQLTIEGPTAREVAFIRARDDNEEGFYTHTRMEELNDDGTFKMGMLRQYDPSFDYDPWLRTARSQFTARLTQQLNTDLAVAGLFRGEYVTRLPFRARFAYRRAGAAAVPAIAASINVPWLPDVDATRMARIASHDEAVEDLRRQIRRAVSAASETTGTQAALSDLVTEIAETAAGPLARKLARDRTWRLAVPGGCTVGTILLGATASPIGAAVGAALALGTWAAPALADFREPRTTASYLFWAARPHSKKRDRRA